MNDQKPTTTSPQPNAGGGVAPEEMPDKAMDSIIYRMWKRWKDNSGEEPSAEKYVANPVAYSEDAQSESLANTTTTDVGDAPTALVPKGPPLPPDFAQHREAHLHGKNQYLWVDVSQDKLSAQLCIAAPNPDAAEALPDPPDPPSKTRPDKKQKFDAPYTFDKMLMLLLQEGIVFGIDQEALRACVENPTYNSWVIIARGTAPVHGEDGAVDERVPRKQAFKIGLKENGLADYKNISFVHNVEPNQIICTIVQPTNGTNGTNVYGSTLEARKGKPPQIPKGKNTALNVAEDALVAKVAGHIFFDGRAFNVSEVFNVNGNVDNSTGNISFVGDVVIRGDVCEGYEVRAKGNITVMGAVEGASLYADGNIVLLKGMNGMQKGVIEAQGNVTATYLESCTVKAKGIIKAQFAVNSSISSDDSLLITEGKGTLVGGKCIVLKRIEAKLIGSVADVLTTLVLGATPSMLAEQADLTAHIATLEERLDLVQKNIDYLEILASKAPLEAERLSTYNALKREVPIDKMKLRNFKGALDKIEEQLLASMGQGRVVCGTVNPPARITIGNSTLNVTDTMVRPTFYLEEDQVKTIYV